MSHINNIDTNIYNRENANNDYIKNIGYGSGSYGSEGFGEQSVSLATCPLVTKYSGDTITLQATPKDGIGPYSVTFKKGVNIISSSRLEGLSNPTTGVSENILITRVYTLDDEDIRTASTGTIDFSVFIQDSCPTGAQTCTEVCTINIGCIAPVCNFVVT